MRFLKGFLCVLILAGLGLFGLAELQAQPSLAAFQGPEETLSGPSLALPDLGPVQPGINVTLPVTFQPNGASVSSLVFSLDYDPTRLSFATADNDHDGFPDGVHFSAPGDYSRYFTLDASDSDGELDFVIADYVPPLAPMPAGVVASLTFSVLNPGGTMQVVSAVNFSQAPAASFGGTNGYSVAGSTDGGSVAILPPGAPTLTPSPTPTQTLTPTPTLTPTVTATPAPTEIIHPPEPRRIYLPFMLKAFPQVYSAAGRITDRLYNPVAGVTISDGQGHSTVTNSNGNYLLEGLPAGTFTLFPVKPKTTFNPTTRTVSLPPDAGNLDFSADLDLASCTEAITNGGFETKNTAWSRPAGWPADWSKNRVHTGSFSMRTGILSGADNRVADSSAYQQVTLPAGTQSAVLRFWIYQESGDTTGDRQEVVLNSSLAGPNPTVLLSELKNTKAWVYQEVAIPASFFGKTIWVGFVTHNDGNSGVTVMYIDDVSLQVCQ